LLQLSTPDPINIQSDKVFPKPAHLNRKDPRPKQIELPKEENDESKDGLTAAGREEVAKAKERRQKEREENLAQVAPSIATVKRINNKRKTAQVYQSNLTDEQKRTIQTNYEEKLPWHLEDWNGEQVFVGHNQVGAARMNAALVFDPSSTTYRMVPVEKVYNFEPKAKQVKKVGASTLEEVEAMIKKNKTKALPDVLTRQEEARIRAKQREIEMRSVGSMYTGGHRGIEASRGGEDADLDFDDDFADDEEGDLFEEKDEDEKAAEKKVKEDQLQANFLDFKDLRDYDVLEERERREELAKKRDFKGVRKALAKREGNYNQGSESEDDSSTDSDEERQRQEAEKLANAKKEEDSVDGKVSALPSGANTPSGRREKNTGTGSDREKKPRPRKRPGSPNLSDASGTDASVARKKKKTKHLSSAQPTPGPSRPMSPDNANLDPSSASNRPLARSTSLTSAGAGSDTDGGAMSDGTRRLKLKMKNPKALPSVRAPSPPVSRPSSPPPPARIPISTPEEARALVPPGGITTKEFMNKAGVTKEHLGKMMPMLKQVLNFQGGMLHLKPAVVADGAPKGGEVKMEGTD
jgi:transcription initiation factor TFIIF subunit alpha